MESANFHNKPTSHHQPKSSSELLSSAKLVAEAAKNTLHHESDKVDEGKVAGAAADLLGAACHYGKMDHEKGVGKYVDKAENYLNQYHTSHSTVTTTTSTTTTTTHTGGHSTKPDTTTVHTDSHSTKPEKHSEPAHGSGGVHDSGSSGYGDYVKMAQGFLKKH